MAKLALGQWGEGPAALFIRRPIATTLLTLGIALIGIAAFFALPVAPLPQVDFPVILVSAQLPGASPEVMATSVATPLERRLGVIADVGQLTSTSSNRSGSGLTQIILQFGVDRDVNGAARDVQAGINAASKLLPPMPNLPTYHIANTAAQPVMVLALTSDTLDTYQIYDAASLYVQQAISRIKGVGEVDVFGSASPAVRVEMNPHALAKYGIGLEDVKAALQSTNAFTAKGAITRGAQRYQIYTNDQASRPEDFQNVVIAYRNGRPVRVRDIADVVEGPEILQNLGLAGGKAAIIVRVSKTSNANIIDTVDRIKAILPQLRTDIDTRGPIDLTVALDTTNTIRASLAEVERTLLVAIVLVVLVVLVFLRNGRATLIPAVAVAVSLLGTLGVMFLLHYSLNNLSLMALTVATGFVVDDAIVVLENITRHVEQGMPRYRAALVGAKEVGFTVISISVSLIAVFLPILAMGGLIGKLFREFSMTLGVSIVISLGVSLSTTPMMAAYLIDEHPGEDRMAKRTSLWRKALGAVGDGFERGFDRLHAAYGHSLAWALDNSRLVLLSLVLTIGLNFYLYGAVPKGLLPQQDTGTLIGGIQVDQASSFDLTARKFRRLQQIVTDDPAVQAATSNVSASGGFMFVALKPRAERPGVTADMVRDRISAKTVSVSGAQLFLQSAQDIPTGGRGGNAQYQYTLQSDNSDLLKTWSDKLMRAMQAYPSMSDVNTDQQSHALETYISVDHATASRLGINAEQVDQTLEDAFGQAPASIIYNPLNEYHVIMEVAQPYQRDPEALRDIYIAGTASTATTTSTGASGASAVSTPAGGARSTAAASLSATGAQPVPTTSSGLAVANQLTGAGVARSSTGGAVSAAAGSAISTSAETLTPLSAIAHWTQGTTPLQVNHQGGAAAATLSFNTVPGHSLGEAQRDIAQASEQIHMPNSVVGGFQGSGKFFQDFLSTEGILVGTALLSVYIVLGILYESYIHPLTVLSTLPSAGVGALLALMIAHVDFSVIAMIGVVLLIGIVKKNAIMIIDFALVAEREQGLSSRDAIYQACMLRFRPILMTTCAAIMGAVPLALGLGEGAELRQPLGIAIIGGLVASQLLTLLTTPVVYLRLDRLRRRRPRRVPSGLGGGTLPAPMPAE